MDHLTWKNAYMLAAGVTLINVVAALAVTAVSKAWNGGSTDTSDQAPSAVPPSSTPSSTPTQNV